MTFNSDSKKKQRGQGITKVSSLFEKYKKTLRAPQKTVTNTFVDVLRDFFNITIPIEQCSYSVHSQILTLRASGMIKSEIQLQKQKILGCMREKLGEKNTPKDIL